MKKNAAKSALELMLPGRLREWRLAAGLSQVEVSRELGYKTAQFVNNWEKGRSSPPLEAVARLIEIYGIERTEILEIMLHDTKTLMLHRLEGIGKVRRRRR